MEDNIMDYQVRHQHFKGCSDEYIDNSLREAEKCGWFLVWWDIERNIGSFIKMDSKPQTAMEKLQSALYNKGE